MLHHVLPGMVMPNDRTPYFEELLHLANVLYPPRLITGLHRCIARIDHSPYEQTVKMTRLVRSKVWASYVLYLSHSCFIESRDENASRLRLALGVSPCIVRWSPWNINAGKVGVPVRLSTLGRTESARKAVGGGLQSLQSYLTLWYLIRCLNHPVLCSISRGQVIGSS